MYDNFLENLYGKMDKVDSIKDKLTNSSHTITAEHNGKSATVILEILHSSNDFKIRNHLGNDEFRFLSKNSECDFDKILAVQKAIAYAVGFAKSKLENSSEKKALEYISKNDFLDTKIDDCDLSIRTKNTCRMNDFKVIGDLIACSTKDLMMLNFGKRTISEIQELLISKGYSFGS